MIKRRIADRNIFPIIYGPMSFTMDKKVNLSNVDEMFKYLSSSPIELIDTAIGYCSTEAELGNNERIISEYLIKYNIRHMEIATKCGAIRSREDWIAAGHPNQIKVQCEQSLVNLKTDSIFLYQLHCRDPKIPLEDSIGALIDLKQSGKIQNIGVCNLKMDELKRIHKVCNLVNLQNEFNLFQTFDEKNGTVQFCEEQNICYTPYSVLGGVLTHKEVNEQPFLARVAREHDLSTYQVLYIWCLMQSESIVPIIGGTKVRSIDSLIKSFCVFTKDEMKNLVTTIVNSQSDK